MIYKIVKFVNKVPVVVITEFCPSPSASDLEPAWQEDHCVGRVTDWPAPPEHQSPKTLDQRSHDQYLGNQCNTREISMGPNRNMRHLD